MSNNKPKDFYKNKRYLYKKKSTKSNKNKNDENNEKIYQSLDPVEANNLLNVYDTYINFHIPYYGWKLFFSDEDYKNDSDTVKKIQIVEGFINRHQRLLTFLTLENLENEAVFTIDMCKLYIDQMFLNEWPDIKKDMYENPLHTLNCFKLAVHQKILNTVPQESLTCINIINTLSTVRLRILNYQPIISLQDLKANSYGRLVSIRGCVIRVGHVKHLVQWIVFTCCKCNLQKIVKQPFGVYTIPKTCRICGTSKFHATLDSPLVKSISFQIIKIQELSNNDQISKGSMPRIVDVDLMDDLVNTCMPGDDVTLTGIIKGTNNVKTKNKISFSLYMEAITIVNNKQSLQNKNIMNNEMSVKDYLAIKEIYDTQNIFPLLVQSLCPSIYGHEIIKAGLMLSFFGGNSEQLESRENIHILIVGDPGLGKSQLLQVCAQIAVKGVYVCGNSSTTSGLAITLSKENKSNNFTLEPGALVLADRGCCCIDEFDKMCKQYAVLLEAMEQESVSVAKSGIICSLPTRTSILAAANPVSGRFNRSKTVMQNLKMNTPLLSRFDLIFFLLDEPNQHADDLLCKHVMSIHGDLNAINNSQRSTFQHTGILNTDKCSLREKLVSSVAKSTNIIPQSILRKYIAYARQYVKPKLTRKAATILQNYYLDLRAKNNKFGGLSVCNRQLEAMIRLTEVYFFEYLCKFYIKASRFMETVKIVIQARAKLELRTDVTETDALDVIEILQYTFNNEITKSQPLITKNVTNRKVKEFTNILRNETVSNSSNVFSMKRLLEIASESNVSNDFPEFIGKLNESGILLKTGTNTFKFVS
ncbi:DNA helicase MCM8 [Anthophora plagiata]